MKRTALIRRTPLRKVSKKRAGELRVYSKNRKRYLAAHPRCERCEAAAATDIHHTAGRNGLLNVESLWRALCRPCHEFVHANPKVARSTGWLV